MVLRSDREVEQAEVGSYCSEQGEGVTGCADGSLSDAPLIELPSGPTTLSFSWDWEGEGEIAICRSHALNRCDLVETDKIPVPGELSVDLDRGSYRLGMSATWGTGNDASYDWLLQVE